MKSSLLEVELRPCDLVLFKGTSLLGKAIRWAETTGSEEPSWANHAGMIVTKAPLKNALIIEAQWKTVKQDLYSNHIGDEISVFRYRLLTPDVQLAILRKMHTYVGDTYGWQDLFYHLADNRLWGGKIILRNLLHDKEDKHPICSLAAAVSYGVGKIEFGVPDHAAQPDDMDDWCIGNLIYWQPVVFRERLEK